MRCAVLFYHKNIATIYKKEWIEKCVQSILNQTYGGFDVFELNYGGGNERYCQGRFMSYYFLNKEFENHIGAMNYLYDLCFTSGYDIVFNVNADDWYHKDRMAKQIAAIENGAQLVSSNFYYMNERGDLQKQFNFTKKNLRSELNRNHNIIAHPVIAMHSSFWGGNLRYVETELGHEDLSLWKKAQLAGKKIVILPDYLLYYRLHKNQVTKAYRT